MSQAMTKWRVKSYSAKGIFEMDQTEESEAEARAAAVRIGTVRGQFAWRVEVHGPKPLGRVAIYKGGKEVKR